MAALRTGEGFPDVVVTAVASTTSIAPDAEETWQRLLQGRSGIRELDKPFVAEFHSPVRIGGALRENFDEHLSRIELRRFAFMQKMAAVLGRRVWEQAGSPEVDVNRLMVSVGLGLGSTEDIPYWYDIWKVKGLRAVTPLSVQKYMPNAPAAAIGLDRKAKAGVVSPVMADASGTAAIAQAWQHIVLGEADIAICGGIETVVEAVRSPRSGGWASCPPTTTTRRAPAARSTRSATGWCSARAARCWSSRPRSTPRRGARRSWPG